MAQGHCVGFSDRRLIWRAYPDSWFHKPPDVTTQSCLSASYDGRFLFQGFLQHNIFSPGGHSTVNIFRVGADGALEQILDSPYTLPRDCSVLQCRLTAAFWRWASGSIALLPFTRSILLVG